MAKKKKSDKPDIHIEGGVYPGRDFVAGDVTYHSYQEIHTENIQTSAEFTAALNALQAQIATLRQQPDLTSIQTRNIETGEKQVTQAVQETRKEKPNGNAIKQTLTEAKETFELLSGSVTAAAGLAAMLT